ncbi:unnamed protein product (macronuclear) [Paramecium tetraurelia]|uniref:Transmembrane protein n=1 Tax=Paramecium tetraurelia TaxID=5888 RepID=A0BV15_PARTE|nr:uncharacterized protein GSPATT00005628001 [Paramecium tetraurelia]CAK62382.1 unnamed protein product [Paramecium tetraurelia]|eukprot:XP_001429780.1 hypothetical protein (macronuclear) [Paramecium tetraurelia strain d4-2]
MITFFNYFQPHSIRVSHQIVSKYRHILCNIFIIVLFPCPILFIQFLPFNIIFINLNLISFGCIIQQCLIQEFKTTKVLQNISSNNYIIQTNYKSRILFQFLFLLLLLLIFMNYIKFQNYFQLSYSQLIFVHLYLNLTINHIDLIIQRLQSSQNNYPEFEDAILQQN